MSRTESFSPKSSNEKKPNLSPKKIGLAIIGAIGISASGLSIKNHLDTPNLDWTEAQIQRKIGEFSKEKNTKAPGSKEALLIQNKIGNLGTLRDVRRNAELTCNRALKPLDSPFDKYCVKKELEKLKLANKPTAKSTNEVDKTKFEPNGQQANELGSRTKHTSQIVNGKRETIYISESHRKLISQVVRLVDEGKIKFTDDFSDKESVGESPDYTGIRAGYVQPEALKVLITLAEHFKVVGIGGTFKIGDMPGHSDGLSFDLVSVDGLFAMNASNGDPKSLQKFVESNKVLQSTNQVTQIITADKLASTMKAIPEFQGPPLSKNGVNHFNANTKIIRIGTTPDGKNQTTKHRDHEHFDIKDDPTTPSVRSSSRSKSPDLFSPNDSVIAPKRIIRKPRKGERIEDKVSKNY